MGLQRKWLQAALRTACLRMAAAGSSRRRSTASSARTAPQSVVYALASHKRQRPARDVSQATRCPPWSTRLACSVGAARIPLPSPRPPSAAARAVSRAGAAQPLHALCEEEWLMRHGVCMFCRCRARGAPGLPAALAAAHRARHAPRPHDRRECAPRRRLPVRRKKAVGAAPGGSTLWAFRTERNKAFSQQLRLLRMQAKVASRARARARVPQPRSLPGAARARWLRAFSKVTRGAPRRGRGRSAAGCPRIPRRARRAGAATCRPRAARSGGGRSRRCGASTRAEAAPPRWTRRRCAARWSC